MTQTGRPTHTTSGSRIHWLETCASTNTEALLLAQSGERGPAWVITGRQTAGRGRAGRTWLSGDPRNLTATFLITAACEPQDATLVPFLAALGVRDAILAAAQAAGFDDLGLDDLGLDDLERRMVLKWPNDILIDGAKLSGILVETMQAPRLAADRRDGASHLVIAIGIGLNLAAAPTSLDQPATSLAEEFSSRAQQPPRPPPPLPTSAQMLELIDKAIAAWRLRWADGRDGAAIRDAWCANANMQGRQIDCEHNGGLVSGVFDGLEPTGALRLRGDDGSTIVLTHGDIALPTSD